jgi:hypothetical protein
VSGAVTCAVVIGLGAFLVFTAGACGGSDGSDQIPPIQGPVLQYSIYATPLRSGSVSNLGFVSRGSDLAIGDNAANETSRGVYSFDVSGVDPQKLESAVLVTDQFLITGTPYPDLGTMIDVVMVDLGLAFDAADFGSPETPLGQLGGPNLGQTTLDVTGGVRSLGFSVAPFEVRLQFATSTDLNGDDDYVNLVDPENLVGAACGRPHLVVRVRR